MSLRSTFRRCLKCRGALVRAWPEPETCPQCGWDAYRPPHAPKGKPAPGLMIWKPHYNPAFDQYVGSRAEYKALQKMHGTEEAGSEEEHRRFVNRKRQELEDKRDEARREGLRKALGARGFVGDMKPGATAWVDPRHEETPPVRDAGLTSPEKAL